MLTLTVLIKLISFVVKILQMGIVDIFNQNANFSGMSNEPLIVNEVIQKAFINVDEFGCEAAEVTTMDCKNFSLMEHFNINHPFIYYIVHKDLSADNSELKTVTTLFVGIVRNPQQ